MAYSYSVGGVLKWLREQLAASPKKFIKVYLKSAKESKLTLFIQTINFTLAIYLWICILPALLPDLARDASRFLSLFNGLADLSSGGWAALMWFVYFLGSVLQNLVQTSSKKIGLLGLFDMNLALSLTVTVVFITLFAIKIFYIDIKYIVKNTFVKTGLIKG